MNDRFQKPESIAEAMKRKRALELDVMNIERQLSERTRYGRDGRPLPKKDYQQWRTSAHSSLVFKKSEHALLKDWIVERRRQIDAEELGIFDPNDPRELLLKTRHVLKQVLAGDDADIGVLYNILDQYLQHAA